MNNFTKRLIFGILYVAIIVFATMVNAKIFFFIFLGFLLFCIYEFKKLKKIKSNLPYILGIVTYYFSSISNTTNVDFISLKRILFALSIFLLFIPFITTLFSKKNIRKELSDTILLFVYIIIPFTLLLQVAEINTTSPFNGKIVLGIFILIWTNDTFAYLVGRKIGKTKLFERISPKKTIEGFIGGAIFSMIFSYILAIYFTKLSFFNWLIIAVIVSVFGTIGDLIESMFKREANLKDSSNLIPGHGGFLDRLDSFIFAIPFIFIYILLIS